MKARPHPNGNDPRHFQEAYVALSDARDAVENAARVMCSNVVHGRNYQHLSDCCDAYIADRRRITAAYDAMRAIIGEMQSEIVEALQDAGEL